MDGACPWIDCICRCGVGNALCVSVGGSEQCHPILELALQPVAVEIGINLPLGVINV